MQVRCDAMISMLTADYDRAQGREFVRVYMNLYATKGLSRDVVPLRNNSPNSSKYEQQQQQYRNFVLWNNV